MKKLTKKQSMILISIAIVLCIALTLGVSYAYWKSTKIQQTTNKLASGCLSLNLTGKNEINLSGAVPISDEEGSLLEPYTFTIENTCETSVEYQINLESLGTTTLESSSVRVGLENANSLYSEYESVATTIDSAKESRKLTEGLLNGNSSKTYNLRIWIDKDAPLTEQNKAFEAKIIAIATALYQDDIVTIDKAESSNENGEIKVSDDKKSFTYTTNSLSAIGDTEEVNVTLKNNNEKYDANANMTCTLIDETLREYVSVSISPSNIKLKSKETKTQGKAAIKLIKAFENGSKDVGLVCRISATATAKEELKENYLMQVNNYEQNDMYINTKPFWNSKAKIKTLTFESEMRDMDASIVSYDLSRDQDKSIIGYLIPNESDATLYDAYIQADGKIMAPESSISLFEEFSKLEVINNIEILDTSNVTTMRWMFSGCEKLTTLDVSNFDTSKVTDMIDIFQNCKSLTTLDVSNFDTSNVTEMSYMFYGCENLETIKLGNFDASNATRMSAMFNNNYKLTTIEFDSFTTSDKLTDISQMLFGCRSLITFDFSNFNTSNVTDMSGVFSGCYSLKEVDLRSFDTSKVTRITGMFYYCECLEKADLSSFDLSNLSSNWDSLYIFNLLNDNKYPENLKITTNAATKEKLLANSYNSKYVSESNFIVV